MREAGGRAGGRGLGMQLAPLIKELEGPSEMGGQLWFYRVAQRET